MPSDALFPFAVMKGWETDGKMLDSGPSTIEQYDGVCIFMPGSSGLADHNAVLFVAVIFQSEAFGILTEEVRHFLLMVRSTRNAVKRAEQLIYFCIICYYFFRLY